MGVFITLCIVLCCVIWLRHILRRRLDPPGPLGIPFIGIILHIIYNRIIERLFRFYLLINRNGKKYGNVSSIEIGQQKFIILHSHEVIRKAVLDQKDLFSGRPNSPMHRLISQDVGVASIDGESWKTHRRFILSSLKTFGLGKQSLEPTIISESDYIHELILKDIEKPVNSSEILVKGVTNIIAVLVFGERWAYDDPHFSKYVQHVKAITHANGISLFLPIFYQFLAKPWIISHLPASRKIFEEIQNLKNAISKKYMDHKLRFNSSNEPSDLIDTFLHQQQIEESLGSTTDFTDEKCIGDCFDLFIAGMDTTTTNLTWCMLMLSLYPAVQERLFTEVENTMGKEVRPQMLHKKRMPYCQAVLDEVARFSTIAPNAINKRVLENTEFLGYPISDTTQVVVDIYSVHYSEQLWDNPSLFKPERFLNENGEYQPSEYLIPFGLGKRRCLGEGLALMENFLMLVSIVQRFSVSLDEDSKTKVEEIIAGTEGIVHEPGDHRIIFHLRD